MIGSVDLPRHYTIRESGHRIHNPLTSEKLATLGQAIGPAAGTAMLDLACGSGELLCTWARDHQVTGTGVDISTVFLASARARAAELGVDGQDSWDRYAAAQWLNIRRWLDAHPDDELAPQMRAELDESPARYARYRREYLGWGVFVLMDRSTR
jgi:SAM-dependent methyltransferase